MGDFNSEYSQLRTWMADMALVDVIGKKHGVNNVPKTYNRSKDSPIDAIFASAHLACALGGFLSFGKLSGDHRGLWVDIPKCLLFGYNIPNPVHPDARRLKMRDPRVVARYQNLLHSSLADKHVYEKMDSLHRRTVFPLPKSLEDEYEVLDKEICDSMEYAEKNCRKLHMGGVKFSPAYKAATQNVEYWTRRLDNTLGLSRNVRKILKLQKKLGIQYDPTMTILQIQEELQKARKERRDCKKRAESLSIEYRHRLAQAKEDAGVGKAATILRNMNRIESQRTTSRNIKHMLGKTSSGSATQVTITNQDGSKTDLTERSEVEAAVIRENERKYHQTEGGSQLLDEAFRKDLGSFGDGPEVTAVLQGTYTLPSHASQATKDFLDACQAPDQLLTPPTASVVWRYKDYVHSWKCRKEKTTSANQHMGHYKACMTHPWLSWLLFQRAEIPTISGYSPSRHRSCIDLMIMKKAMSFDLEKQRTLGILDTEFNHLNKRMQYKAMHLALDHGQIATEQYSRPDRTCIDHALNRRLTADDRQAKRLCWALAMSDLKGCYDRVVHTAAALALLRIGVSRSTIYSMFGTIQRMIHRVRTAFGDSEETYGGDDFAEWLNAPQGFLQGNAAGPTIWATLSSVIFSILRKKGHSDQFCSAISKNLFLLVGFAFVDDCDLIQSGQDPREVAGSMQSVISEWRDLMEVTGGALETKKSYWYLIDYEWVRGKWTATNGEVGDFELLVRSVDNEEVAIERLDCDVESEMLGIWMSPSGEKKRMIAEMRETALNWGAKVRLGKASPADSLAALHTTISMKLKYPLAALTLTEKECNHIMAPAIRAALPKAGFSGSMSSVFRHAPIASLGLNVTDLYTTMGTMRTALLVHHCWKQTPTGQLLRTSIENQVLEMGMYGLIWSNKFPTYSKWCSNHSWLFHVCQFNNDHEIRVNVSHATLKPKRLHDIALMDVFQRHFDSKSELRAINRVRMLHKVVSLSDICTADGARLDTSFLSRSEFGGCRNDFIWPTKHHVSSADYTMWSKAMEFAFAGPNQSLIAPLGDWLVDDDQQWLEEWDWFVSASREFLYFRSSDTEWYLYVRRGRSHRAYSHHRSRLPAPPVEDVVRATVTWDDNAIILECVSRPRVDCQLHQDTIVLANKTLSSPSVPWIADYLQSSPTIDLLLSDILEGTAVAVSDGSYFEQYSTAAAAWTISSKNGCEWIEGGGIVPGIKSELNSYRAELAGLLGQAVGFQCLLPVLPQTVAPPADSLVIGCDNIRSLEKTVVSRHKVKGAWKSVDLVTQILDIWSELPFQPLATHVYGHRDERIGPLTFLESLNVRMDTLAKSIALRRLGQSQRLPQISFLGYGTITVGGNLVSSRLQQSLCDTIHQNTLIEYLAGKWEIDEIVLKDCVCWTSIARARKHASFAQRKFITKWISGDTPSGLEMHRRQQRDSPNCPVCLSSEESLVHILTCSAPDSTDLRSNLLQELHDWLIAEMTCPWITDFLIGGFQSWFNDPCGHEPPLHWHGTFLPIAQDQLSLGWYATLLGFFHDSLVQLQHRYYKSVDSRKTGISWAKKVTIKLWNIIYQIWMNRNSILHESEAINKVSGLAKLQQAITTEHARGPGHLHRVYNRYFRIPLPSLLTTTVNYQKQWFLVIRAAREATDLFAYDAFATTPSLRSWVGLPPLPEI